MITGSSGATPRTRCRPVPAPVHRSAARRDRPAGGAGRRRDQRGEEGARRCRDRDVPRRGRGREAAETARRTFEEGAAGEPADARGARAASTHRRRAGRARASPPRRARRGATDQGRRRARRRRDDRDEASCRRDAGDTVRVSAGKKAHGLLIRWLVATTLSVMPVAKQLGRILPACSDRAVAAACMGHACNAQRHWS